MMELPSLEFRHCRGSDLTKRGYPCSLWILFHSLTVQQALQIEQNRRKKNEKFASGIENLCFFSLSFVND